MRFLPLILAGFLLGPAALSAQVRINEVVASNVSGLSDEDGDTSDWIELWNYGSAAVNVGGWGLSDDPADPYKWILPGATLDPGSGLVVYASGKGDGGGAQEFLSLVTVNDDFDYWPGNRAVPQGWRQAGFNTNGWSRGPSGFGFGDGDDATLVNEDSVFIRREFTLSQNEIDSFDQLYLHVDFDDGYVAYLNGVEIGRENMSGIDPPYSALADDDHEAQLYTTTPIAGKALGDPQALLVAGVNVLALQAHNASTISTDLSLIPFLTAARASATPNMLDQRLSLPGYRPLHSNFKLKAEGESLVLTDASGLLVDSLDTGQLFVDTSIGRDAAGTQALIFLEPTPGALNTTPGRVAYADPTSADQPGGFYPAPITVNLSVPPGAVVHYSLNGDEPNQSHPMATGPITIPAGVTPLRARAFQPGKWGSPILTETYIVGPVPQVLPTVSVVTKPALLFGPEAGIYLGSHVFGDDEIPAHVEVFELGGTRILSQDIGLKIHGGFGSRLNAQRSLRVIARGGYGKGEMEAALIPGLGIDVFKQFLLRNAGNDWCYAHLRDGLMHRITAPEDLETMAFQPTVVFINGEYYGIHNLRERQDEDYLAQRKGIDPDQVDILELGGGNVIEGDREHWEEVLDLIRNNNLNDPQVWADVESRIDVDNLATYCIMEVWGGNDDWPQNNIKWWRPRTPDGRWRWMLYDTDFVFGRYDNVMVDTLTHLYQSNAETAEVFRALMDNDGFRRRFINRYADYMNEHFRPSRTKQLLADIYQEMSPEIDRHMARWRGEGPFGNSLGRGTWLDQLRVVSNYLGARNGFTRQQIRGRYHIPGDWMLSLDVSPPGAGSVHLTAIDVNGPWRGEYFQLVPVDLSAVPAPGFVFDHWSDPQQPQQAHIEVVSDGPPYGVTAVFLPSPTAGMVIREINYNSSAAFDPGDWVELYNNSSSAIDLSGWSFEDSASSWPIPAGTVVPSGGTVVLARDLAQFTAAYGLGVEALGDLGFGFSGNGERLRLRDGGGLLVDEVTYDDAAPWPTAPDGGGPTLQLTDPNLDNDLGANWQASAAVGGTPGS